MRCTCDLCGVKKPDLVKEDGWMMQHLHIHKDQEQTTEFLTCDKCKTKSPFEFLKKLEVNQCNQK